MKIQIENKIFIIGGHLTPALAVLDELQSRGYKNIFWIGIKHSQTSASSLSAEYKVIKDKNIQFINFKSGKIWRKWTKETFFYGLYNLVMIPIGFIWSFLILLFYRPTLVVSFGGYLALPFVINARILGVKSVTHEQTMVIGLANKIIAKFANKILLSWNENLKQIDRKLLHKVVVTGNPIRKEVLNVTTNKFNFDNKKYILYITGGNQGSNTINVNVFKILPQILENFNVIHQVGGSSLTNDLTKAKDIKESLSKEVYNDYILFDNLFNEEIGEVLNKSSLILSRSGANSVSEILALSKLSILIPIPWSSNNEQLENAKLAENAGLGLILTQDDNLKPQDILIAINRAKVCLDNNTDYLGRDISVAKNSSQGKINLNAREKIVDEILTI